MNKWKEIFTQSPANNGYYNEKELTERHWEWPRGTWLQSRLEHVREREPAAVVRSFKQLRRVEKVKFPSRLARSTQTVTM